MSVSLSVSPTSAGPRLTRREGVVILSRTLVKLGGSLLSLPDLGQRVVTLLSSHVSNPHLLVGGGESADLVRTWDGRFHLTESNSHQLAIRAMQLNAHLVASLDDRLQMAESIAMADELVGAQLIPVLEPVHWISETERRVPAGAHLEASWDTTSDSIAAWLSKYGDCGFDRLLLLKSVDLPAEISGTCADEALQAAGLVDPRFAGLAKSTRHLAWCNLQADRPHIVTLRSVVGAGAPVALTDDTDKPVASDQALSLNSTPSRIS